MCIDDGEEDEIKLLTTVLLMPNLTLRKAFKGNLQVVP